MIRSLHHVQLAMPRGREADARAFYCDVLGMIEQPKPDILAQRGGAWFSSGEAQVHLGVEDDFRPAKKVPPWIARDLQRGAITPGSEAATRNAVRASR